MGKKINAAIDYTLIFRNCAPIHNKQSKLIKILLIGSLVGNRQLTKYNKPVDLKIQ